MIDASQSCTLAGDGGVVPRERAPVLLRSLLDIGRAILLAMHESRGRQAEAVLRRHDHLIRRARAHALAVDAPAPRADGDER